MQLPLFPLELFLLPEEKITLHIFEPRYKRLVKDVLSAPEKRFAIPFFSVINTGNFASVVRITNAYNYNSLDECDIDITCENIAVVKAYRQSDNINFYPIGDVLTSVHEWKEPLSSELFDGINDHSLSVRNGSKPVINVLDYFKTMNPNVIDKLAFVSRLTREDREKYVLQYARYFQNISEQETKVYESIYLN